jgi:hypothetical protein
MDSEREPRLCVPCWTCSDSWLFVGGNVENRELWVSNLSNNRPPDCWVLCCDRCGMNHRAPGKDRWPQYKEYRRISPRNLYPATEAINLILGRMVIDSQFSLNKLNISTERSCSHCSKLSPEKQTGSKKTRSRSPTFAYATAIHYVISGTKSIVPVYTILFTNYRTRRYYKPHNKYYGGKHTVRQQGDLLSLLTNIMGGYTVRQQSDLISFINLKN